MGTAPRLCAPIDMGDELMDGPGFDVRGFLAEPLRPASVATVTGRGRPALAMVWFVLAEGRLWSKRGRSGSRTRSRLGVDKRTRVTVVDGHASG